MEIIFNFVWIMFNFLMLHVDCVQLAKSLGEFNYVWLCSTEFDCRLFDSRTMLGLVDLFSILLQIKVIVILMTLRCQAKHSFCACSCWCNSFRPSQRSTLIFLLTCPLGNYVSSFTCQGYFLVAQKNQQLASLTVSLNFQYLCLLTLCLA